MSAQTTIHPGRRVAALLSGIALLAGLLPPASANAATLIVNTAVDENDGECSVDCSLRDAVALAAPGDSIQFSPSLNGSTLALGSQVTIAKDLTITGPGADDLTISAGATTRLLLVSGGTVSITGLSFTNGSATPGGAIANHGTLTLTDSYVANNSSGGHGGALYNNGSLTVVRSTLEANTALGAGGGGAIFNDGLSALMPPNPATPLHGRLTVRDSTFRNNQAGNHGGAIFNFIFGFTEVSGSTFDSNLAGMVCCGQGGAMINDSASSHVVNSTFVNNMARVAGGGHRQFNGAGTFVNSTFVGNAVISNNPADPAGGAISGGVTFRNSIAVNNTKVSGPSDLENGGFAVSYSLLGTAGGSGAINGVNGNKVGYSAAGVVSTTLAANGGPTETLALENGSPALDSGKNADALNFAGAPLAYDQRGEGHPRIMKDVVDMGAFEAGFPPLDHFQCYEADHGRMSRVRVMFRNVFEQRVVEVDAAARFCNPTEKLHGEDLTEITDPDAHLTWYRIRKAPPKTEPRSVTISNQFGEQRLRLDRAMFLAVPTQKTAVDPAEHGPFVVAGTTGAEGLATGVMVNGSVTLSAAGMWSCGGEGCEVGPEGMETATEGFLLPGVPAFALLARIGDGPWELAGAGPATLTGFGELVFAMNDDAWDDNYGSVTVSVSTGAEGSSFPEDLDHFACYYAKGSRINETVGLRDQFDGDSEKELKAARILSPSFLCVPSDKLHAPDFEEGSIAQRPADLLACYTMDAGKSRHRVRASNQFHEDLELELADARTLCVPSMAAEGPEPD